MKSQNYLENHIQKFELMPKLQREISKNKIKKLVIESNPQNEVLHFTYKNTES